MPTYLYETVPARRQHTGKCPVCGKRVTRARTFEHTINPYNRNVDGQVKTYDEVLADVNAVADAWVPDFMHDKCARVS